MKSLLLLLVPTLICSFFNYQKSEENKPAEEYCSLATASPYTEPKYINGITTSRGTYKQKDITYDRMNVSSTWDTYRGDKVKVAIIDTGILTTHEDFSGTNISSHSYDFYSKTNVLSDGLGHGTGGASCIAASVNDVGGLGIAPNAELYVYKVSDSSGNLDMSCIKKAITRAIEDHVDIINLSIQGYSSAYSYSYTEDYDGSTQSGITASGMYKSTLQSYITSAHEAGITIVASAGNYNISSASYPAANDYVIGVGSTSLTDGDTKSGYSNYGSYVDVCAPGYAIMPAVSGNDKYQLWWGTSFSAPLVSGAIALYKQKYPSATPDQIEARLKATCDSLAYSGSGFGKVNVANFLNNGPAETWVDATGMSLPLTATIAEGVTEQIVPTFTPTNTTRQTCYWSSSDETVATVDYFGNVTTKKIGTVEITAVSIDGGYSSTCHVTVGGYIPVENVFLSPSEVNLSVGQVKQLSWSFSPLNPTNTNVIFNSSDESVATVDENGLITAIGAGNATITILTEDGYFEAYSQVTVTDNRTWNLVTDESELIVGDKYILAEKRFGKAAKAEVNSGGLKNVSPTFNSDKSVITATDSAMELVLGGTKGAYTLTYVVGTTNKILGCSAAKNVNLSGTGTTTWDISIATDGTATIYSKTSSYGRILFNKTGSDAYKITTYTSSTSSTMVLPQLYHYGSLDYLAKAITWSKQFVSEVTCDNGATPPNKTKWSNMGTSYVALYEESKAYFEDATYTLDGSTVTPGEGTNQYVAEAVARYDYIVSKYIESDYPRFMDRTVNSYKIRNTVNNNYLIIFAAISVSMISILGLFLVIKKKGS